MTTNTNKNFISALLVLCLVTVISCKKEISLPDPLKAGWKGQKVAEVIEDFRGKLSDYLLVIHYQNGASGTPAGNMARSASLVGDI